MPPRPPRPPRSRGMSPSLSRRPASGRGPLARGGRVLVIAAHPDDEILGCGGTVALHAARGDHVTSVIACEGESLRYGPGGVGQAEHSRRAAETLGVTDVRSLKFPDQRLDTITLTEIITPLERVVREVSP